jgi:D-alanine-D-alanine ligase
MRIGLAFDLKSEVRPEGCPDDWDEEFDSPVTITAITEVLEQLGHTVILLGNGRTLVEQLLHKPPDLVFNLAEGVGSSRNREARVPAVCELLGIPCTGPDPLTAAVALDKSMTRRLAADAGVLIPNGLTLPLPPGLYDGDFSEFPPLLEELGIRYPVLAKPVWEGSSKGIRNRNLIETPQSLGPIVQELWQQYRQAVLLEEFIAGAEVTVALIGNNPPAIFGIMQVLPRQPSDKFIYSLEVKRNYQELVEYQCPAKLPTELLRELEASSLAVWDVLGCRDVARLDFRIRDGRPYFLEVNPLPGLHPIHSDLVLMAKALNYSYPELIQMILEARRTRPGSPLQHS